MNKKNETIIIIEDHPLYASAIESSIREIYPGCEVLLYEKIQGVENQNFDGRHIKFILMDLILPDSDGYSGVERIISKFMNYPVAIISGRTEANVLRKVRALGVVAFIPKTLSFSQMTIALRKLFADGSYFMPNLDLHANVDAELLSPAEDRVMQCLLLGFGNKQIAFELSLAESTVKSHLAKIFSKLGVTSRSQALIRYSQTRE